MRTDTRAVSRTTLALVALLVAPLAAADVFHLKGGGQISGQLLDSDDQQYRIRTLVGEVRIDRDRIEKIEPAETIFPEYDRRVQAADTDVPADHVALAKWCAENGLQREQRLHLLAAIKLDPDYEPARRALGHVRVAGRWIDGRGTGHPPRAEPAAPDDEVRLAEAVRREWLQRILLIQRTQLSSDRPKRVAQARERILAIDDPLAIGPLVEVLRHGDVATRDLLIETLGRFEHPESTMHLAMIGLLDPDKTLRQRALVKLAQRDEPRVVAEYRRALQTGSDPLVLRAAWALGELGAAAAVPDLIDVLTAQRTKWVEVPVKDYFAVWPRTFADPGASVGLYGAGGGLTASAALANGYYIFADEVTNEWQRRTVTVFRTQVLEALRKLTNADFGFERQAWLEWYDSQRDQPTSPGEG